MATHPNQLVSTDWMSPATQQPSNTNEVPVSPSKQPRLIGQVTPTTPTRRSSSFPYPLPSPRTPQRMNQGTFVTSPPILSPPGCSRPTASPNVVPPKNQGFVSPRLIQQEAMHGQPPPPPPPQSPFSQDSVQDFIHPTIKEGYALARPLSNYLMHVGFNFQNMWKDASLTIDRSNCHLFWFEIIQLFQIRKKNNYIIVYNCTQYCAFVKYCTESFWGKLAINRKGLALLNSFISLSCPMEPVLKSGFCSV